MATKSYPNLQIKRNKDGSFRAYYRVQSWDQTEGRAIKEKRIPVTNKAQGRTLQARKHKGRWIITTASAAFDIYYQQLASSGGDNHDHPYVLKLQIKSYLNWMETAPNPPSPQTLKIKRWVLGMLRDGYQPRDHNSPLFSGIGHLHVGAIDRATLVEMHDRIARHSTRTATIFLREVKHFFAYLLSRGVVSENPADGILPYKHVYTQRKAWTLDILNDACENTSPQFADFLRFVYYTGLDIGDARKLTVDNIISSAPFHLAVIRRGKTKAWARGLILPEIAYIVTEAQNRGGPVLINKAGEQWSDSAIQSAWQRLRDKDQGLEGYSLKGARVGCAQALRRRGYPDNVIQDILGHLTLGMTEYYAQGQSPEIQIAAALSQQLVGLHEN